MGSSADTGGEEFQLSLKLPFKCLTEKDGGEKLKAEYEVVVVSLVIILLVLDSGINIAEFWMLLLPFIVKLPVQSLLFLVQILKLLMHREINVQICLGLTKPLLGKLPIKVSW